MNQSEVLAYCRQHHTTDEIIAILNALTGTMHIDSPVCVALDKANDELQDIEAMREETALWAADDVHCRTGRIPAFLTREAA